MTPSNFLKAVCPDGLITLAVKVEVKDRQGKPFTTFKHVPAKTHDSLLAKADKLPDTLDVFFALASWKQGFHENAKGKKVFRVRDNVDELKALWFDIDFKDTYKDLKEVAVALNDHCKQIGLPSPSILVTSGNGVHAYWPLEESIPVVRWQVLADAFKEAAKKTGLRADLVCTADACRILRLPGSFNNKDPQNQKPVKIIRSTGRLFSVAALEAILLKDDALGAIPQHLTAKAPQAIDEFSGTHKADIPVASFANIVKHCGVAKQLLETRGADCSEPEWKDSLQLLKFCEDGEFYLPEISDGHPSYNAEEAREKFAQRKENTAGPTLCETFATYQPEICHKCPHWGKVKTPVHLGQAENKPIIGLPMNYRIAPKGGGIDKLTIDEEGNKEWIRVLRYTIDNLRVTRSVQDGSQECSFEWWAEGGEVKKMEVPSSFLGNANRLREFAAESGMILIRNEAMEFIVFMGTWIEQLQRNRRETKVTEQLGWVIERNEETEEEAVTGFSCGSRTFMRDGTEEGGVRVKREYEPIAKHYEPKGSYKVWQEVASFITKQNYPAFTAVLSTAFAAPLIRFTGEQGALISLYSSESGVGKSSAMKIAQSVWGSPVHGINSVNDTRNSVTRKIGFINNLPAYWDELRGEGTMDEFCELAFQITQGKEKSRLDSSARLRTSVAWNTMMVAASNDSVFDALGSKYKSTDAGMARVFEIVVMPVAAEISPSEIASMVDRLQLNYGHAGREYAKYIANNYNEVEKIYLTWAKYCDAKFKRKAVERFWFAAMTTMLTGATVAGKAGIVDIDVKKLATYLGKVLSQLRHRTSHTVDANSAMELVAQYEQAHQDRILTVKSFPAPRVTAANYEPEIVGQLPHSGKIIIWRSLDDAAIRFSRTDFSRWLLSRDESPGSVITKLKRDHKAVETKSSLALGTKLSLPRMQVLEVPYE